MFYKGKNVLVAGGAGLMGQSLIRKLLEQGAFVRATQYRNRKIAQVHKNLQVITCDLNDEEQAKPVFQDREIVFLTAGFVGGAKQIKEDPSSLVLANLYLRSKQIYLASKMGARRCAFISSSYVYPHTGRPNREAEGFQGDPWAVNYGLGWVERYLETLCKHFHMTSKTRYAIVRPAAIYGPHDRFDPEHAHVVPALIAKAVGRQNPFEVWGDGEEVRSFTYADDLADGLLLITEKYAESEALNICPKETNTVKDVVRILLDYLDFHPKVNFRTDKPSLNPYKVLDPSRARERLGWEAQVSLEEGLRRTVDWYRENISSLPASTSVAL